VFFGLWFTPIVRADSPATRPVGKLPHLTIDAKNRQVLVDCQAVQADMGLEFLAVVTNTNEYEALVRSEVKPSDLHLALLMLGMKPGQPIHFSEATRQWFPPTGPPLQIEFRYEKDGRPMTVPANRWMRDVKTKAEAPAMTWVFTGSRVTEDGSYAADSTGCLVGVVNNELSVIDVPALASRALEARSWERNPDLMPGTGSPVTMVLTALDAPPLGAVPAATPSTEPAPTDAGHAAGPGLSDVHIDQAKVDRLRAHWEAAVAPHRDALREAARAHYEVIAQLRQEQQRLIDEADQIQRTIDQLEKDYQAMTTPQPEATTDPAALAK